MFCSFDIFNLFNCDFVNLSKKETLSKGNAKQNARVHTEHAGSDTNL